MRISEHLYFMNIAHQVASRSTCVRRQIGAVVVRDSNIMSTGYNGAPRGLEHCTERGCLRNELDIPSGERHEVCRAVHAEQNAILQAGRDRSVRGHLYTTIYPCIICAKMIINAGIVAVYYQDEYGDRKTRTIVAEYFNEAGILAQEVLDIGGGA